MKRNHKETVVQDLAERLARARAVVLTDFTGLKVDQMTELRRKLRESDQEYLVVKNTLFRLASQGTALESLARDLSGPNGLGLSYDDPVALAKNLSEFAKDNPKLEVRSGVLGEQVLDFQDLQALAKLPSREILLAQLLGTLNGVARNLVSVLAAVPRGLVTALKQIEEQKAAAA